MSLTGWSEDMTRLLDSCCLLTRQQESSDHSIADSPNDYTSKCLVRVISDHGDPIVMTLSPNCCRTFSIRSYEMIMHCNLLFVSEIFECLGEYLGDMNNITKNRNCASFTVPEN